MDFCVQELLDESTCRTIGPYARLSAGSAAGIGSECDGKTRHTGGCRAVIHEFQTLAGLKARTLAQTHAWQIKK